LQNVPTLGVLNHVITYIPSLNLFLDSTAGPVAAGYLPASELDKPVVLTKTGQIKRTPATQKNIAMSTTEFRISAHGAADFNHSISVTGGEAEGVRYLMRNLKPSDRDLLVERVLQLYGQRGSGTLDAGNLDGTGDAYQIGISGHTDNLVNLPGPIGVPTMSSFVAGILQAVFGFTSEKERAQPFLCLSTEFAEQSRFILPNEISIVAVPKPVTLRDANFDYSSEYVRQDNAVVIKRHYRFHRAEVVCNPDDFKAMLPAINQMIRDLRSQIIVQAQ